ncbi:IQ domain-containing protein IQM2-like isoform X2 [Dioscorea cayenensis subsp. rotundata]|uniref:IQ domain-containing protein IQM2-like isoform X2 n=1 Tax=Dioscorea cayennensis subsp. rotundata TaxID=55577 RepID=A0AB40BSN2_DIOCR|nr:IQ domain-containing protein IQM2-like isoform X2 [Dioscorea cayenensis subsp. rotundata]
MARIFTLVRLFKNRKKFRVRKKFTLMKWSILLEMIWMKVCIGKKTKTAPFLWRALGTKAAKVGKGLSNDTEALKLELQHWLEAIDHSHRYGHNLNYYYEKWHKCQSRQPFFYWLDIGEGRMINLEEDCPRSKLQKQIIKYLGQKERQVFEVMFEDGRLLYKLSKRLVDTTMSPEDTKWIFVLSTKRTLYVGQKKKGVFQHSSFLSGAAILAAGSLVVEKGILKMKLCWCLKAFFKETTLISLMLRFAP